MSKNEEQLSSNTPSPEEEEEASINSGSYEYEDEKNRRPFKIVDVTRELRIGLTASSLFELVERARIKFDIELTVPIRIVLEVDGTEIDDNDYFTTLEPDTPLMILCGEDEKWTPYRSILTLGLALEPNCGGLEPLSGNNSTPASPVEELVWRLHQDLSFFPWLTPKELDIISKMDREEMKKVVPDVKFLDFLQDLSQRYLQDKEKDGGTKGTILHDPIKLIRMYSKSNAYLQNNSDLNLRQST